MNLTNGALAGLLALAGRLRKQGAKAAGTDAEADQDAPRGQRGELPSGVRLRREWRHRHCTPSGLRRGQLKGICRTFAR